MSWCPKTGPGGIFQSVTLGVADMRGDPWVVSELFEMVCNGFRRALRAIRAALPSLEPPPLLGDLKVIYGR